MENLLPAGTMGSGSSLVLRVSEVVCSVAGVLFMCEAAGFYQYSSFRFLVIVMGVMIPWSVTLAIVDGYFIVFIRTLPPRPRIILMVVIIHWILAMLSLAASCAAASTADFLYPDNDTTSSSPHRLEFSAAVAFLCFAAICANALSNIWILPSIGFN